MNVCPHCGSESPPARVLCPDCGGRLHAAPKKSAGKKVVSGFSSLIKALFRLVFTLVLVGLIALIFWPVEPQGSVGASVDADKMVSGLGFLARAKSDAGPRLKPFSFSEEQVNGYFERRVEASGSSGGAVKLEGIQTDFLPGELVFHAGTLLGPVSLTWELTMVPAVEEGGTFPFEITKARLGHLPLLGGLKPFAAKKVARLFTAFNKEQEILEALKKISVNDGYIKVGI